MTSGEFMFLFFWYAIPIIFGTLSESPPKKGEAVSWIRGVLSNDFDSVVKTIEFGCQFPEIMLFFYSFLDQQQKFLPSSMEHRKGLSCRDSSVVSTAEKNIIISLLFICEFDFPTKHVSKEHFYSKSLVIRCQLQKKNFFKKAFFFWECDSESLEGGYTTRLATKTPN